MYLLDPDALGRLSTELAEQWYAWSLMCPPWMSIVVLPMTAPPLVLVYFIRDGVVGLGQPGPPLPSKSDEDLLLDVLSVGESFSLADEPWLSGDWGERKKSRDQFM